MLSNKTQSTVSPLSEIVATFDLIIYAQPYSSCVVMVT